MCRRPLRNRRLRSPTSGLMRCSDWAELCGRFRYRMVIPGEGYERPWTLPHLGRMSGIAE